MTQSEQRLTSLSLVHKNYMTDIESGSVETECNLFIQKHLHKKEKASLLIK